MSRQVPGVLAPLLTLHILVFSCGHEERECPGVMVQGDLIGHVQAGVTHAATTLWTPTEFEGVEPGISAEAAALDMKVPYWIQPYAGEGEGGEYSRTPRRREPRNQRDWVVLVQMLSGGTVIQYGFTQFTTSTSYADFLAGGECPSAYDTDVVLVPSVTNSE